MTVTFDIAQYKTQIGHRRAQRSGAEHEVLVDVALNRLRDEGVLAWHPTGPPIKFLAKDKIITTGPGPADRLIGMRGQAIWMEIKVWANTNQNTYRERLHQFETMAEFARFGFIGSYLVRWHTIPEWRLHPLTSLSKIVDGTGDRGYGLLFARKTGILVPENHEGVPDLRGALEALCSL